MSPPPAARPPFHLARRMIVLLVCLSLGMHWVVLQGIAWTGMFIAFAREGAVMEAVEKTFDGEHACALCQKVKEGRESSGSTQPQQGGQGQGKLAKIDAVLVAAVRLVPPAAMLMTFAPSRAVLIQRNELPETPPPRRAQA